MEKKRLPVTVRRLEILRDKYDKAVRAEKVLCTAKWEYEQYYRQLAGCRITDKYNETDERIRSVLSDKMDLDGESMDYLG